VVARQVADRVWNLGGGFVNFYAIEAGGRVTLVDTGVHGDWGKIVGRLGEIGRDVSDVEAVLLTHAHRDHTGTAERIRTSTGAEVRAHPDDVPYISHGGFAFVPGVPREGLLFFGRGLLTLAKIVFRNTWAARGLAFQPVAEVEVLSDEETIDAPGRPTVYHAPGHTPGAIVIHLPERGVLFSGDVLVTVDVLTLDPGPRVSPRTFNFDHRRAVESLAVIEPLEAKTILPGHGDPWTEGTREAVAQARRRAAAG
jgi:glyoxylase-like metal-dependent hydrolase (beta-lactamase superfamily II)